MGIINRDIFQTDIQLFVRHYIVVDLHISLYAFVREYRKVPKVLFRPIGCEPENVEEMPENVEEYLHS